MTNIYRDLTEEEKKQIDDMYIQSNKHRLLTHAAYILFHAEVINIKEFEKIREKIKNLFGKEGIYVYDVFGKKERVYRNLKRNKDGVQYFDHDNAFFK